MYYNRSRGFTLIELLVVIAIIGILSAVVLASLNTARSKGQDAAIQSDLSTIQTQAEIYYSDTSNSYLGMCADADIDRAVDATDTANGGSAGDVPCNDSATEYAVQSPLVADTANDWCVDSTGYAGKTIVALGVGDTACN